MESLFDDTYTKEFVTEQLKEMVIADDNGNAYALDRNKKIHTIHKIY